MGCDDGAPGQLQVELAPKLSAAASGTAAVEGSTSRSAAIQKETVVGTACSLLTLYSLNLPPGLPGYTPGAAAVQLRRDVLLT